MHKGYQSHSKHNYSRQINSPLSTPQQSIQKTIEKEVPRSHFTKHKYLSYILMIVSCTAWVTGYLYSNDHNISPIQTSMIRGFMIMIVSAALCKWQKVQLNLKNDVKLAIQRNLIFIAVGFAMAIFQFYIPLSILYTLSITGPVFVTVWQYVMEKKVPHLNQYIAICLTIVGIVLASNGRMLSIMLDPQYQFTSQFANYHTNDPKIVALSSIIFVIFMLLWGYSAYYTNKMNVSPFLLNFLFGAKLYLISSVLYPFINYSLASPQGQLNQIIKSPTVDPQIFYWGFLCSGILFSISQTTFAVSLVMAQNIGMTSMMVSSNAVVAYIVSIVRYHQEINIFCLIGSLLIIIGLAKIMLHS